MRESTKFGFEQYALPMTPKDTFNTWEAMQAYYPADVIADANPDLAEVGYFERLEITRISLQQSKQYETFLKQIFLKKCERHSC